MLLLLIGGQTYPLGSPSTFPVLGSKTVEQGNVELSVDYHHRGQLHGVVPYEDQDTLQHTLSTLN